MKLGRVNVDEMLSSISWRNFLEWQVFSELEPFDETRQDFRIASIVTMLANINRDSRRRSRPYTLQDSLLMFGDNQPVRTQTWQDQKQMAQRMVKMYNALQAQSARRRGVPENG